MTRKKTKEEFIKELTDVHGDKYTLLGDYISSKKKTNFKCNSCGDVWETIPERVVRGANCPVCSRKHLFKTHEQFIVE